MDTPRLRKSRGLAGGVEISASGAKHSTKHFRGEHARVGIVPGAMIADENSQPPDIVCCTVTEWRCCSALVESRQGTFMRDAAERHDGGQVRHFGDGRRQKIPAGSNLRSSRLVLRGDA